MHAVTTIVRLAPGVLLCCALAQAGIVVVRWLALPVPGAVLGLLAYSGWLASGRGIAWSRPGAALLLRWIGALIVPALVGLTAYAGILAGAALPLAAVLVVTTVITALATALIFRAAGGR
ncbi:MAG: CidA/LrgA family protein [Sandarakinorhabdus sp.]|nr:CidA/LrgA family protein [Sandarakinorhabdus sp.]